MLTVIMFLFRVASLDFLNPNSRIQDFIRLCKYCLNFTKHLELFWTYQRNSLFLKIRLWFHDLVSWTLFWMYIEWLNLYFMVIALENSVHHQQNHCYFNQFILLSTSMGLGEFFTRSGKEEFSTIYWFLDQNSPTNASVNSA